MISVGGHFDLAEEKKRYRGVYMETATEPKEEIISTSKQQKEQPADGTQYSIYDFFRIEAFFGSKAP